MQGLREKRSFLLKNPKKGLHRSTFTSLSDWVQIAVEKVEKYEHEKKYVAYTATSAYKKETADDMLLEQFGDTGDETRDDALYWANFTRQLYEDIENGTRDAQGYHS